MKTNNLINQIQAYLSNGGLFNPELADHLAVRNLLMECREALAQPEQEPVTWKLVPIKPTEKMLKAMDECSTEGYDERLYAGHAASVYMAAVDVAPTPPQRTWVGLTDEEKNSFWKADQMTQKEWDELFAAIEAKLRSKNESKN